MNDPRQPAETFFTAIESAWNAADGERYGAQFADVTDFVNIRGEHHHGDGSYIGAAHQGIFDTIYKGSTVRYDVDEAREVAPGVVVAQATSTLDAPTNLKCTQSLTLNGTIVPACTGSANPFTEKFKGGVPLTWSAPGFGQIRSYTVWRAVGSFPTLQQVKANASLFNPLVPLSGAPPSTSLVDTVNLKSNTTYTYFITATNKQGAASGASTPLVVLVKF